MLLPWYLEYQEVFEKTDFDTLPDHWPWDHTIKFTPDFKPVDCSIYPLTEAEQVALKEFLEENLCIGRIRLSKSPMASPFCFIKKKDGLHKIIKSLASDEKSQPLHQNSILISLKRKPKLIYGQNSDRKNTLWCEQLLVSTVVTAEIETPFTVCQCINHNVATQCGVEKVYEYVKVSIEWSYLAMYFLWLHEISTLNGIFIFGHSSGFIGHHLNLKILMFGQKHAFGQCHSFERTCKAVQDHNHAR